MINDDFSEILKKYDKNKNDKSFNLPLFQMKNPLQFLEVISINNEYREEFCL